LKHYKSIPEWIVSQDRQSSIIRHHPFVTMIDDDPSWPLMSRIKSNSIHRRPTMRQSWHRPWYLGTNRQLVMENALSYQKKEYNSVCSLGCYNLVVSNREPSSYIGRQPCSHRTKRSKRGRSFSSNLHPKPLSRSNQRDASEGCFTWREMGTEYPVQHENGPPRRSHKKVELFAFHSLSNHVHMPIKILHRWKVPRR
jgi:hypothetical protein